MSAESVKRNARRGGQVVRPQQYNEKTVVENVFEFLQDVVPQGAAYNSTASREDKDQVLWIKFLQGDINDRANNPDLTEHPHAIAPLLFALGYSNGAQVWCVPATGEAQELVSWRDTHISSVETLPHPDSVFDNADSYSSQRPLIAVTDCSSNRATVSFVSLRTGEPVKQFPYTCAVEDVRANKRVVVVALADRLEVFDACSLKPKFTVKGCYPTQLSMKNTFAIGKRLLAYASNKLCPIHESGGGMSGAGGQSYTATVLSAAKQLTEGLQWISGSVVSSVTGARGSNPTVGGEGTASHAGVVTVLDVQSVRDSQFLLTDEHSGEGVAWHFVAHAQEPLTALQFNESGSLLVTADKLGHYFNVFQLVAHPWASARAAVHHLYLLYRGDTTALVQNISLTTDSRWVAVSTWRGTTHVFPITPYGGPITARTHCSLKVVNKSTRFHRSAGIDEVRHQGSFSSNASQTEGESSRGVTSRGSVTSIKLISNPCASPREPPFPHPITVQPLAQIKQVFQLPGVSGRGAPKTGTAEHPSCVAAVFGPSRGWLTSSNRKNFDRSSHDSLFVLNWSGTLVEHALQPRGKVNVNLATTTIQSASDERPLELLSQARAQWNLQRQRISVEIPPPAPTGSPLLLAAEAVATQRSHNLNDYPVTRQESRESLSSDHSVSDTEDQWLAQVEIITHAGPGRRLWMGPQFSFKTYQNVGNTTVLSAQSPALLSTARPSSSPGGSASDDLLDLQSLSLQTGSRSSPIAMPQHSPFTAGSGRRDGRSISSELCNSTVIEAGSFGDSPLMDLYSELSTEAGSRGTNDLKRDLEDAMMEYVSGDTQPPPLCRRSTHMLSTSSSSSEEPNQFLHAYDAGSTFAPCSLDHVIIQPAASHSPSPS